MGELLHWSRSASEPIKPLADRTNTNRKQTIVYRFQNQGKRQSSRLTSKYFKRLILLMRKQEGFYETNA
jgi:hypothetical protein